MTPGSGPTFFVAPRVGHIGVSHVVGLEVDARMLDFADLSFAEGRNGQSMHRVLNIVEADQGNEPVLPSSLRHLASVVRVGGQRLLAVHMLACGDRGHGDFEVRVVGRANVDDVDLRILDDATPVVGRPPIAPFAGDATRPALDQSLRRFRAKVRAAPAQRRAGPS